MQYMITETRVLWCEQFDSFGLITLQKQFDYSKLEGKKKLICLLFTKMPQKWLCFFEKNFLKVIILKISRKLQTGKRILIM